MWYVRISDFIDHVLKGHQVYSPLLSNGSYCVVSDTGVEYLSKDMMEDRQWGSGNNPLTAVWEFLKTHSEFEIEKSIEQKLLITSAPDGYLKRMR